MHLRRCTWSSHTILDALHSSCLPRNTLQPRVMDTKGGRHMLSILSFTHRTASFGSRCTDSDTNRLCSTKSPVVTFFFCLLPLQKINLGTDITRISYCMHTFEPPSILKYSGGAKHGSTPFFLGFSAQTSKESFAIAPPHLSYAVQYWACHTRKLKLGLIHGETL